MSDYTAFENHLLDGDYSSLSVALGLGGRVVEVSPAKDATPGREEDGVTGAGAAPLSTSHISPFIEYRAGASLLKSCKGGQTEKVGGGVRRPISGFSNNSRRRLLQTIGGVRRDAALPLFVTLTYPAAFPDPKQSKSHLRAFFKRLERAFPGRGLIWKLEPQQRGAPHYHLLLWSCDLQEMQNFVPGAWYEIAGGGDRRHLVWHEGGFGNSHCVQQVLSWKGVWSYAAKYLGKTFEVAGWSEKWTGRFWGVVNRDDIPFGELIQQEVTLQKAVELQRYQRRFGKLKRSNRSVTIFCDAGQWVDKLIK